MWVSVVAGPRRLRDLRPKPLLPERRPAETLSLKFRLFNHAAGSPENGTDGIMNSRDPSVNLPTGTLRSSSTTLRDLGQHQPQGDPGPTTPPGTRILRVQQSHRHRMSRAPKPLPYKRPKHNGFSDVAVRADSNGTAEGSTPAIVSFYAAVRVFSTATPAVRLCCSTRASREGG